jgi:hypothetical protein
MSHPGFVRPRHHRTSISSGATVTKPVEALIGGVGTRFNRVTAPLGRMWVSAAVFEISSIMGLVPGVRLRRESVRCARMTPESHGNAPRPRHARRHDRADLVRPDQPHAGRRCLGVRLAGDDLTRLGGREAIEMVNVTELGAEGVGDVVRPRAGRGQRPGAAVVVDDGPPPGRSRPLSRSSFTATQTTATQMATRMMLPARHIRLDGSRLATAHSPTSSTSMLTSRSCSTAAVPVDAGRRRDRAPRPPEDARKQIRVPRSYSAAAASRLRTHWPTVSNASALAGNPKFMNPCGCPG